MSLINKQVEDFKVQAYHAGEFKEVTLEDVKGKWAVFFSIQLTSHSYVQLN